MFSYETYRLKFGWILILAVILAGCGTGYRIHRADGVETLYHVNGKGGKRIVYVVDGEGILTVHDENDPLIQQFLADNRLDDEVALFLKKPNAAKEARQNRLKTQRLVRLGRIKAAKKRRASDPIHVATHGPELGPAISQRIGNVDKTKHLIKQVVVDEMNADQIIHLTLHNADVDIYFKSYLKETAALNIKTHKLVPVNAFHFEAFVQSNYLSENRQTIKGLGHLMEYRQVIKRTIHRVNQFIKEEIGSTIPKDRKPFLSTKLPKI